MRPLKRTIVAALVCSLLLSVISGCRPGEERPNQKPRRLGQQTSEPDKVLTTFAIPKSEDRNNPCRSANTDVEFFCKHVDGEINKKNNTPERLIEERMRLERYISIKPALGDAVKEVNEATRLHGLLSPEYMKAIRIKMDIEDRISKDIGEYGE
jgi:hypothetical protein